jgi:hypothetical protein
VATAISLLLLSLRPANAGDYVYAALFLTCTSAVLKLRWFVGATALAAPVLVAVAANLRLQWPADGVAAAGTCMGAAPVAGPEACRAALPLEQAAASSRGVELVVAGPLPLEALVHILVAWAVGALMAFLSGEHPPRLTSAGAAAAVLQSGAAHAAAHPAASRLVMGPPSCAAADSSRRESFVAHKLALAAAAKELEEVQARVLMERELAQAQQQARGRAAQWQRSGAAPPPCHLLARCTFTPTHTNHCWLLRRLLRVRSWLSRRRLPTKPRASS